MKRNIKYQHKTLDNNSSVFRVMDPLNQKLQSKDRNCTDIDSRGELPRSDSTAARTAALRTVKLRAVNVTLHESAVGWNRPAR